MNNYDITLEIFGRSMTKRVEADSLDEAWEAVNNLSILEILKDLRVVDLDLIYHGSSVSEED